METIPCCIKIKSRGSENRMLIFFFFSLLGKVSLPPKARGTVWTKQSWIMEKCRGTYPPWTTPLTHRMLNGLYYEAGNDSNHMIFATIKQKKLPICRAFLRQKAEIWTEWILKFLSYLISWASQSCQCLAWSSKDTTMPWCYHSCGCWTIWPLGETYLSYRDILSGTLWSVCTS